MKKVFTDLATYRAALDGCDLLFLLRPPQISEVGKYFKPLIDMAKTCNIQHILFLSVQGVEHSSIIPHHKIEQLIVASKIPYTFFSGQKERKNPGHVDSGDDYVALPAEISKKAHPHRLGGKDHRPATDYI